MEVQTTGWIVIYMSCMYAYVYHILHLAMLSILVLVLVAVTVHTYCLLRTVYCTSQYYLVVTTEQPRVAVAVAKIKV